MAPGGREPPNGWQSLYESLPQKLHFIQEKDGKAKLQMDTFCFSYIMAPSHPFSPYQFKQITNIG